MFFSIGRCMYEVPMKNLERLRFENSSLSIGLIELLEMSVCIDESLGQCMLSIILCCIQCNMRFTEDQKTTGYKTCLYGILCVKRKKPFLIDYFGNAILHSLVEILWQAQNIFTHTFL